MKYLARDFFLKEDVVSISRDLLGKHLYTYFDGKLTGGKIVETEAYCHKNDRACHAYSNRRTQRNEIMYHRGGVAYVYLCYGIHYLFNIVTNGVEKPDAVLIRALEPIKNKDIMQSRRKINKYGYELTNGPGKLSQALGITKRHYGIPVTGEDSIWVTKGDETIHENQILTGPRVGIDFAKEDADLPWRFRIKNNPWTSKPD